MGRVKRSEYFEETEFAFDSEAKANEAFDKLKKKHDYLAMVFSRKFYEYVIHTERTIIKPDEELIKVYNKAGK